jgi:lipid-A-disaccharide synthase-like uncharacterized protein
LKAVPTENDLSLRDTTIRFESRRAVFNGILETAGITFLVYISVRVYDADSQAKSYLAAGGAYGLLVTPLVVFCVARRQWRGARAAASLFTLGGMGFLLAALWPTLPVFVFGSLLGLLCSSASIPLFTQIYQNNYPAHERGRLFSRTVAIRITAAMLFSYAGGWFLRWNIEQYRVLLLVFAAALFASAVCALKLRSEPLNPEGHHSPFKGLHWLRDDPIFRLTLISWMLMGIANLMMVSMRVEFLANPEHGPPLDPETIALVTGVIPNATRLALSRVWGRLFDRMNFFLLRIFLNVGFALGGIAFFTGRDMPGLVAGALIFGVANAGGDIAWSLWVTKLAPSDRVAEYMSVHTFFTGVRGVLAPHIAFWFITGFSFNVFSLVCGALIVAASCVLIPEARIARARSVIR